MSSVDGTPSPSSLNPSSTQGSTPSISLLTPVKAEQNSKSEASPIPVGPRPLAQLTSFSEWQLMAVLQRANLVQYYDTFISQGGDDINQIMQCDEQEFLEIMSLVGMLSKPLHVRRFQRALTEFSKDQSSFNLQAIQQIGAPPPLPQFPIGNTDPMSYLMPGLAATLSSLTSSSPGRASAEPSSPPNGSTSHNSVPLACGLPASIDSSLASADVIGGVASGVGGTANIVAGQRLRGLPTTTHKEKERSSSPLLAGDFVSLGESDPNIISSESAILSPAQISRINLAAQNVFQRLPSFEPKLVQNKKRVSREVLDLMSMSSHLESRIEEYRKYSAIYGRFDAKRKPHKVLTLHEVSVNEAAAQLCLLMPALLTRRDELFPLARQVVREAGYHYSKGRKRTSDMTSPCNSPPPTPPPTLVEYSDDCLPSTSQQGNNISNSSDSSSYLERWSAARMNELSKDS